MSDAIIEPRTLRGFHDRLPSEALVKERMLGTLKKVFESFAYVPIETPHLEYLEVLTQQSSDEIEKQLYRFKDAGGRDIGLRFDLTVPFARFISQHRSTLGVPFKRYAVGNVFRGERPQAGRYREFTQCDFDFVGTESVGADAEIVEVIAASMLALGIKDFVIRINNRKLMNGFAEALEIPDKASDLLRIIDKTDKVSPEEIRNSLKEELGLSDEKLDRLLNFIEISRTGKHSDVFKALAPFKELNEHVSSGINDLERLFAVLADTDIPESSYCIDLTIARGLGYYTGIVYETSLLGLKEIGSVCSGGRYDNLTATFSKEALPGVGASVGIDRLIAALETMGLADNSQTPAKLLVMNERESDLPALHGTASKLRAAGIEVEVFPDPSKLKKQFEYTERKGHAFLLFIEQKDGKTQYKLRDSQSREQYLPETIEEIAKIVSAHK